MNNELRMRKENKKSADVPRLATVRGGERIDGLSHRVYESPEYYIDVAGANRIVNFRKLKAGRQLIFPPAAEIRNAAK